ncbi:TPA: hypothetical protein ACPFI9_003580 [Providencia rettgeri]
MSHKFLVIDPFIHLSEHTLVDRSFIEFFSQYDSIFLVNQEMKNKCLDLKGRFIPSFIDFKYLSKFIRLLNREIIKTSYTIGILILNLFMRRNVVFLAMSQLQYAILGTICYIFRFKVSIVMHHYSEAIIKKKDNLTFGDRTFLLGMKMFSISKNTNFIYLSKHIKNTFELNNISITDRNFFINHPIPLSFIKRIPFSYPKNNVTKIATIGLLSKKSKSSDKINELAHNSNIELWAIGRLSSSTEFELDKRIKTKLWRGMYSIEEFESSISNIDFFIYFFNSEQYQCTASGTLIDAILYNKGVLCLENKAAISMLENYNNKYIFNSIDDMNSFLEVNTITNICDKIDSRMTYCLLSETCPDTNLVKLWARL